MFLCVPNTSQAQTPTPTNSPTLSVLTSVGWDGKTRLASFVPLFVDVENTGNDLAGKFVLDVGSETVQYEWGVELPANARKQFYWTFFPFSGQQYVELSFVSDAGERLFNKTYRIQYNQTATNFAVLISDQPEQMATTALTEVFAEFANQPTQQLPHTTSGWDGINTLIIADTDTGKLSAEQRNALKLWVAQGNQVLVFGGNQATANLAALADLAPIQVLGQAAPSAEASQTLAEASKASPIIPDPLAYTRIQTTAGEILASVAGDPLIVRYSLGNGDITYFSFDPTQPAFRDWQEQNNFWAQFSNTTSNLSTWNNGRDWERGELALNALASASLPQVWQLCLFVSMYIIWVGPINFILLALLKRRALAWVTIPAISALFVLASYLFGYGLNSNQAKILQINFIQSYAGTDRAKLDALVGIFSPRRARYDFTLNQVGSITPYEFLLAYPEGTDIMQLSSGDMVAANDVAIDVSGIRAIAYEGEAPAFPIQSEFELSFSGTSPNVRGKIVNQAPQALQNAKLLIFDEIYDVGDLAPGASFSFDQSQTSEIMPLNFNGFFYGKPSYYDTNSILPNSQQAILGFASVGSDREKFIRTMLINWALSPNNSEFLGKGMYLIGWSDDLPFAGTLNGKSVHTTQYNFHIIQLDYAIQQNSQQVSLTNNQMRGSIYDIGSEYNLSIENYYLYSGWYALSFAPVLPLEFAEIDSLTLDLTNTQLIQAVTELEISLWDYTKNAWQVQKSLIWGVNTLPNPQKYVNANGEIRIKFDATQSTDSVYIESVKFSLTGTTR
jgi:hypothetical protein